MRARTLIECVVDPTQPVQEINGVISLMLQSRSDEDQKKILESVKDSVNEAMDALVKKPE